MLSHWCFTLTTAQCVISLMCTLTTKQCGISLITDLHTSTTCCLIDDVPSQQHNVLFHTFARAQFVVSLILHPHTSTIHYPTNCAPSQENNVSSHWLCTFTTSQHVLLTSQQCMHISYVVRKTHVSWCRKKRRDSIVLSTGCAPSQQHNCVLFSHHCVVSKRQVSWSRKKRRRLILCDRLIVLLHNSILCHPIIVSWAKDKWVEVARTEETWSCSQMIVLLHNSILCYFTIVSWAYCTIVSWHVLFHMWFWCHEKKRDWTIQSTDCAPSQQPTVLSHHCVVSKTHVSWSHKKKETWSCS